jgi:Domain of unknown function (DUF4429)/Short C-terminal domain
VIEAKGANGHVTFDGRTVTITRKGFLARATVGKGTKAIPVHQITGVQWKKPGIAVRGFIQFTVPGGIERRSTFGSQTPNAVNDENSVLFDRAQIPQFEALRDAIQESISAGPQHVVPQLQSVADELAKLAQLRDSGVLTQAEFDAQKSRLLNP